MTDNKVLKDSYWTVRNLILEEKGVESPEGLNAEKPDMSNVFHTLAGFWNYMNSKDAYENYGIQLVDEDGNLDGDSFSEYVEKSKDN